jgi:hypothetical protein
MVERALARPQVLGNFSPCAAFDVQSGLQYPSLKLLDSLCVRNSLRGNRAPNLRGCFTEQIRILF